MAGRTPPSVLTMSVHPRVLRARGPSDTGRLYQGAQRPLPAMGRDHGAAGGPGRATPHPGTRIQARAWGQARPGLPKPGSKQRITSLPFPSRGSPCQSRLLPGGERSPAPFCGVWPGVYIAFAPNSTFSSTAIVSTGNFRPGAQPAFQSYHGIDI